MVPIVGPCGYGGVHDRVCMGDAEEEIMKWHNSANPPHGCNTVLIYMPGMLNCSHRGIYFGYYSKNSKAWKLEGGSSNWTNSEVTHWMDLPEPPKGEK